MTAENFRTIWLKPDDPNVVQIIDQRLLPHAYTVHDLRTWQDADTAIADNAPPVVAFTTVALGSFRGLVADFLWLRSNRRAPRTWARPLSPRREE